MKDAFDFACNIKYFCDGLCAFQETEKDMSVHILVLHLFLVNIVHFILTVTFCILYGTSFFTCLQRHIFFHKPPLPHSF